MVESIVWFFSTEYIGVGNWCLLRTVFTQSRQEYGFWVQGQLAVHSFLDGKRRTWEASWGSVPSTRRSVEVE